MGGSLLGTALLFGWGHTVGKGAGVPPSGPEASSHSPPVFASSDKPRERDALGPLHLLDIVATAGASTSAYVTWVDLTTALPGLKGTFFGMLAFMAQSCKKHERSPSSDPPSSCG